MTASDRTDAVLAAIDGALSDWEVSGDAMRWTPEPPPDPEPWQPERPEPLGLSPMLAMLDEATRPVRTQHDLRASIDFTVPGPPPGVYFGGEPIGMLRELGITPAAAGGHVAGNLPPVWRTDLGMQVLDGIPIRVDPTLPPGWLRLISDTDSVTWRIMVRETAAASPVEDILRAVRALGYDVGDSEGRT